MMFLMLHSIIHHTSLHITLYIKIVAKLPQSCILNELVIVVLHTERQPVQACLCNQSSLSQAVLS